MYMYPQWEMCPMQSCVVTIEKAIAIKALGAEYTWNNLSHYACNLGLVNKGVDNVLVFQSGFSHVKHDEY